jgi:predicted lipase
MTIIKIIVLFSFLTATLANVNVTSTFDMTQGLRSVGLSAAAYCDPSDYMTRSYKGNAAGFVATNTIVDSKTDTQGFIGYMASTSQIYVTFRGSESISNWATNLDAITTPYPESYGCPGDCQVHKGFFTAEQSVIDSIITNVGVLSNKYPSYSIWITGHSLGAALATLTALDLQAVGFKVNMQNFGSPRVGTTDFANWVDGALSNHNRNTHHKDMVPHIPMHERFTHIDTEWYEDPVDSVKACTGNEDPDCSYQWSITSISDHLLYLNQVLGSDGCAYV